MGTGTLMLEGCLQMMAFYLAAMGYTLDRDGWRFEPVLDHSVNLRCRGQVLPHDEELICVALFFYLGVIVLFRLLF